MWLFFGLGTLAVVLLLFAWRADPVSRLDRELAAREPLQDAEMVSRFFVAEHGASELPIRVRRLFAEHTGLPA